MSPFIALFAWILVTDAWADPSERAERLAALRGEVEALNHQLQLEQSSVAGRLQSLDLSRSELEVQARQEELLTAQLQLQLEERRALVVGDTATDEALVAAARAGVAQLRPVIADGLPYRVTERLAALDDLLAGLDAGTLPPHRAVGRLWQTFEDELRLTRENGLDRQTITLDGQEMLVDVARIGAVALFFRAPDGRSGWAEAQTGGWTWRIASDRTERGEIDALFDALDKQIRVGQFTLPAALPAVTR
jgi:hypothetical protein